MVIVNNRSSKTKDNLKEMEYGTLEEDD